MEPTLHEGQLLLVSGLLRKKQGDVVVARVGTSDVVKRLAIKEDGQQWLKGDNDNKHHDIRVSEGVRIIGKVIGQI